MRILYTMIRVADLDRSLAFYTGPMGMTMFRREDYPEGRFTLAFVGYGNTEDDGATIELTWNWDAQSYDKGLGWGHIAIGVDDVAAACERLKALAVCIVRPAGPMAFVSPQRYEAETIAFISDPDGYRIELVEHQSAGLKRGSGRSPIPVPARG